MSRNNENHYTFLETILTFTIMLMLLSMVAVPAGKKLYKRTLITADKLTARNIHNVVNMGLTMDSIEAPNKDIYIVVENPEDITSSLDREYRRNLLKYLNENLNKFPDRTKTDKKKYIIKITSDCNVEIMTGSNLGDYIYPVSSGAYANIE